MKKNFFNRIVSVVSSVVASIMVVALVGYAATTISTDIDTGGTLTVSGASTLSGNLALNGGSATTTITGGLRADTADNTLVVDFSSSRVGIATTSPSVLFSLHGAAIFGAADADVISFRAGALQFNSNATTTITTKGNNGIAVNTDDLVLDVFGNLFGIATSAPRATLSVGGDSIFGSADASIASFRAGDIQFNSNATTTITTKNRVGITVNTSDLVLDAEANLFGIATTAPRSTLSVSGDTLLGSADGSIVSLRAGDIQFNSNATTTITTKNLRGINVNAGDFVLDTQSNTAYIGTSTPIRGSLGVYGSATTSLVLGTSAAGSAGGSCIELDTSDGKVVRLYATTSPRTACAIGSEVCQILVVEAGGC